MANNGDAGGNAGNTGDTTGTNAQTSGTGDGTSTSTSANQNTEPKPGGNDTGNSGGTLTQAQVDAIVRDRIAREREKYKGFDDLKAKAEAYDAQQAANQTDLEKAQTEATKAKEKADAAEGRMRTALTRAAIIDEASKQGAKDPALLVKLIDAEALQIADDGTVSGAAEAVTALLAAHDYLKGGSGFTGSGDGGQRTNGGLTTFTRSQIANPVFYREHQAEIDLAYTEGRITDG